MAFPATVLDVTVEAAFGADLTADPSTWTFTAITTDMRERQQIRITRGRADETSLAQPSTCVLALNNQAGDYTPYLPTGTHYPYMRRGLPLRVTVDNGGGDVERFSGYVSSLRPTWDVSAKQAIVAVTAAGPLQRIQQRTAPAKSALRRAVEFGAPQRYWTLEDGGGVSAVAGIGPLLPGGDVSFGGGPTGGTAGVADLSGGGSLTTTQLVNGGDSWRVEIAYTCAHLDDVTGIARPLVLFTSGSIFKVTAYVDGANGDIVVLYEWSGGSSSFSIFNFAVDNPEPDDGLLHHIRVEATQVGADVHFSAAYDGETAATQIEAGRTIGTVTRVKVNDVKSGITTIDSACHLGYWSPIPAATIDSGHAADGYLGELAGDRIARLCAEEGVTVVVTGGADTVAMGAQPVDTFINLLRECERTDGGVLYDGRDFALAYLGHAERFNLPVALALDWTAGHVAPPFEPAHDYQRVRNDVTVTGRDGATGRVVDQDSIDEEGRVDEGATANPYSPQTLVDLAGVRERLGTVAELRYSTLALTLHRNTGLIDDWMALDAPARVTVDNLPAQHPPDLVDLVIDGYTETLGSKEWRVAANCSPASPWSVAVIEGDGSETQPTARLGTGGCELVADVTSGATSIRVVTTAGPKAITTAGFPSDFPFDIDVGGERMTVTACADATAAAFVAAGVAATDGNASGTATLSPGLPAGLAAGHAMYLFAAIRPGAGPLANVSVNTPTGWRLLRRFGGCALFGRIAGSSESSPTVSFTGGFATATVLAQIAAFSNASAAVISGADQLNTATQDIAYPSLRVTQDASVLLYLGWKRDDWTSVATISGATEIGEPDETGGGDDGIVWDYLLSTTAPTVNAGSFTVTGGAAEISRGAVVALGAAVQTFTVTRAVNGVTKAHTGGARVGLWRPAMLGY